MREKMSSRTTKRQVSRGSPPTTALKSFTHVLVFSISLRNFSLLLNGLDVPQV